MCQVLVRSGHGRYLRCGVRSAEATIPAAYGRYLIELVGRWNVPATALLDGLPQAAQRLADPDARVSLREVERLIARARKLTGEEGIGVYLGLQIPVSAHGFLGFAAMTARTLREACELAERFAPTRTEAFSFRLEIERGEAHFIVEERADFGSARDVLVLALLTSLVNIGRTLVGGTFSGRIEFAFPEPPYYRRLAGLLGGPAVFGRPRNQIVFAAEMLDAPVLMHDPVAQRLAREQCERELEKFGAGGQFLLRVRSAMTTGSRLASLGEVARQMGISERTLKRRLAECGTSYSQLVAELLYSRALQYLRDESLSMEQVAERLGYSDAANFTRAFRRWSGTTPALFRRTLRTAEPGRPEPPVTSSARRRRREIKMAAKPRRVPGSRR